MKNPGFNLMNDSQVREYAERAFRDDEQEGKRLIHARLHALLADNFTLSAKHDSSRERDENAFAVKQSLISEFLNHLDHRIDQVRLYQSGDFSSWWNEQIDKDKACPHPLFKYLATEATLDQIKEFIRLDSSVHVHFADVLASMQIGTRGTVKREFFENFSDELSPDDSKGDHFALFTNMVKNFNLTLDEREEIPWQALACANALWILSLHRSLYFYGIGYLGCLEAHTPGRFRKIIEASQRLQVPPPFMEFYILHTDVDANHAERWLKKVIEEEVKSNPERAQEISKGLLYRFLVADDFWGYVLKKFQNDKSKTDESVITDD